MANESPIVSLGLAIAKDTVVVDAFFKAQDVPSPSFDDVHPPKALPYEAFPEVAEAYERILVNTRDLQHLLNGPRASMRNLVTHNDTFTMQAIIELNMAEAVPLDGESSFEDIAAKVGVAVLETRRIIRYAATNHIFKEVRPGIVAHTPASRMLAEDRITRGAMSMMINETAAASAKTVEAMQNHSGSQEAHLSGWGLFNNASAPMFEELARKHPKRAKAAEQTMDFYSNIVPTQPLIDNFPWESLGRGTVVDVGGAHGPVSIALAKRFPDLKFVVQDLAGPVTTGRAKLPAELKERISFAEHDFFTDQPVKDADVYFFRATLHNWPDKDCVRMLKALVPALKKGAHVVINDACLPEPGAVSRNREREMRAMDLNMLHLFNARDREVSEWKQLFAKADPGFDFRGVTAPVNKETGEPIPGVMSIIDAVWSA